MFFMHIYTPEKGVKYAEMVKDSTKSCSVAQPWVSCSLPTLCIRDRILTHPGQKEESTALATQPQNLVGLTCGVSRIGFIKSS